MILSKKTQSISEADAISISDICFPSCDRCVARYVSMCSALEVNELNDIAEISKNITAKPKQQICAEGDVAEHLFNIKSGCVRISKTLVDGRRQIIGFLFPGEFFGLACSAGYSYTAETVTDTELCRMPRSQLIQKISELPELGRKVLNITNAELQRTQDQMVLLGRKRAREKLVTFILNLKEKFSTPALKNSNEIFLPMSRSDIADYLGLTIETVSRQFTILNKEKLISLKENQLVQILDLDQLHRIASGE